MGNCGGTKSKDPKVTEHINPLSPSAAENPSLADSPLSPTSAAGPGGIPDSAVRIALGKKEELPSPSSPKNGKIPKSKSKTKAKSSSKGSRKGSASTVPLWHNVADDDDDVIPDKTFHVDDDDAVEHVDSKGDRVRRYVSARGVLVSCKAE